MGGETAWWGRARQGRPGPCEGGAWSCWQLAWWLAPVCAALLEPSGLPGHRPAKWGVYDSQVPAIGAVNWPMGAMSA